MNAKGEITLGDNMWLFTPDVVPAGGTAHMVMGVDHDIDYLSFGYWVQTTEKANGDITSAVGTFASGSQPFTTIDDLLGTATYTGSATGMFVKKEGPVDAAVATTSGQFTADAELMAKFGGPDVATNDAMTISGTVTGFEDSNGDSIANWTAALEETMIADNTYSGDTTGAGQWSGAFYGNPLNSEGAAVTNNENTALAENAPLGVAGEFNAHFGNGHVIGAFGATR